MVGFHVEYSSADTETRGSSHQLQPSLCEVFGVLVHRDGPYRHAAAVRNGSVFQLSLAVCCLTEACLGIRVGFHQKKVGKIKRFSPSQNVHAEAAEEPTL